MKKKTIKEFFEGNSGGYKYYEAENLIWLAEWGKIKNKKIKKQKLKLSLPRFHSIERVVINSKCKIEVNMPVLEDFDDIYFTKLSETDEKEFEYLVISFQQKTLNN